PRGGSQTRSGGGLLRLRAATGAPLDAHAVEGAPDEDERDGQEYPGETQGQPAVLDADGELDGEQTEEGSELDHRVHGHRGGVLEGIAHGVTDHRGLVERGALGL